MALNLTLRFACYVWRLAQLASTSLTIARLARLLEPTNLGFTTTALWTTPSAYLHVLLALLRTTSTTLATCATTTALHASSTILTATPASLGSAGTITTVTCPVPLLTSTRTEILTARNAPTCALSV